MPSRITGDPNVPSTVTLIRFTSTEGQLKYMDSLKTKHGWSRSEVIRQCLGIMTVFEKWSERIELRAKRKRQSTAQVIAEALTYFFRHHG